MKKIYITVATLLSGVFVIFATPSKPMINKQNTDIKEINFKFATMDKYGVVNFDAVILKEKTNTEVYIAAGCGCGSCNHNC